MKITTGLAMLAAVALLAACTAAGSSQEPTMPPLPPWYTAPAGYTPPSPMPTTMSSIPDGIYRTRVRESDVAAKGGDPNSGGTWTYTLAHGRYTLQCQWVDQSGTDCGTDGVPANVVVEAGPVRGDATTVWFASEVAATCQADPNCGTADPYSLSWKLDGNSLVLTDFTGYGGQATMSPMNYLTVQPWTKIG